MEASEFGRGLDPPAPDLGESQKDMSDAELFWIIKNGIRMTGMPAFGPTHGDEQIWQMVTFVRHLPQASEQEHVALQEAVDGLEYEHEGMGSLGGEASGHPGNEESGRSGGN